MVSAPSFDPNLFVTGISFKAYAELRDSIDRPLFNRILRGLYPPGSTIKPAVAIAALDAGVVTPATRVFDPGFYQLPNYDHKYRNWNRTGDHAAATGAGHCAGGQQRCMEPAAPGPNHRGQAAGGREPDAEHCAAWHGARGTARKAAIGAQYRIAGKSGTAQVVAIKQGEKYDRTKVQERHRDHALFVGFAPADNPKIVVAVMVENGESGSGVAAPVVRQVMDAWLLDENGHLKPEYAGSQNLEAAAREE